MTTYTLSDLPGDKSLTHRSYFLSHFSPHPIKIINPLMASDTNATKECLEHYKEGSRLLDCKNSGTTMRHLMALLAFENTSCTLVGDDSLSKRPMDRISHLLTPINASFSLENNQHAPVLIHPSSWTKKDNPNFHLPVASAQLKSALLFMALKYQKKISLTGKIYSRDHTEKLFRYIGQDLCLNENTLTFNPTPLMNSFSLEIPADPSCAVFPLFLFLMKAKPGDTLIIKNLMWNPTRTLALTKLLEGHTYHINPASSPNSSECMIDLTLHYNNVIPHSITISEDEAPMCIDEITLLAAFSLFTKEGGVFSGTEELKVKESNRLEVLKTILEEFGVPKEKIQIQYNKLIILPMDKKNLTLPKTLKKFHDHRMGMLYDCLQSIAGSHSPTSQESFIVSYPNWDKHFSDMQTVFFTQSVK